MTPQQDNAPDLSKAGNSVRKQEVAGKFEKFRRNNA